MKIKCMICDNAENNKIFVVKERIINKGDTFQYMQCSSCGTLSLIDIPEDISVWYPVDYNPYTDVEFPRSKRQGIISWLKILRRKILMEILIHQKSKKLWNMVLNWPLDKLLKRLYGTNIKKEDCILDVGCATGIWLDSLYDMGWKNITGIDAYIPNPSIRQTKWRFIKGEFFDLPNEKFDYIIMNHSFEHMNNPLSVLQKANELLNLNGVCIISIPLAQGPAWREYGVNYVQIDAPRHIFLYTTKSMKMICEKSNFYIDRILYDSHEGIFYYSEELKNTDKSHNEVMKSFRHTPQFEERARLSNIQQDGDEAIFYLKKSLSRSVC